MKGYFILIIITLLTAYCGKQPSQLESILRLEDRRVQCDSLAAYLDDADPKIRSSAVEAIGKLQDESCVDRVVDMLADKDQEVRAAAIFALVRWEIRGEKNP